MPPKPKFTREEIVQAALETVREKGLAALTARELAARLGSSPRPVFTVFKDMKEVREETFRAAEQRLMQFLSPSDEYTPVFKQVGLQTLRFAVEEPNLYQLLFMTPGRTPAGFDQVLAQHGGQPQGAVTGFLAQAYGLTREEATELFGHVWLYTYGIGALCALKICTFSQEELVQMLGENFQANLAFIRSGGSARPTPTPVKIRPGNMEERNGKE